jgi:hypothetical protein
MYRLRERRVCIAIRKWLYEAVERGRKAGRMVPVEILKGHLPVRRSICPEQGPQLAGPEGRSMSNVHYTCPAQWVRGGEPGAATRR